MPFPFVFFAHAAHAAHVVHECLLLDQIRALQGAIHKGDMKSIVSNAIKLKLSVKDRRDGFGSLVSSLDNAIAIKEFSPACLESTYRELEDFQAALNNKLSWRIRFRSKLVVQLYKFIFWIFHLLDKISTGSKKSK